MIRKDIIFLTTILVPSSHVDNNTHVYKISEFRSHDQLKLESGIRKPQCLCVARDGHKTMLHYNICHASRITSSTLYIK
ncbi:hypothetical protein Leryth_016614 [Lithospermum erythrorhizon]|nr:hypothetical protein Leryth_016614 [Lithospermum erythrorhizon]